MSNLFNNELAKLYMKNASGEPKYVEEEEEQEKKTAITEMDLSLMKIPQKHYPAIAGKEELVETDFIKAVDTWDFKQHWCLFLGGSVGTGKSFAAARWLADKKQNKHCWVLFGELKDIKFNMYQLFLELCARRYLVIDEIGVHYDTNPDISHAVFNLVIEKRYGNNLPTILTTNMKGGEMKQRFDTRLRDRLKEGTYFFSKSEKSLRKRG